MGATQEERKCMPAIVWWCVGVEIKKQRGVRFCPRGSPTRRLLGCLHGTPFASSHTRKKGEFHLIQNMQRLRRGLFFVFSFSFSETFFFLTEFVRRRGCIREVVVKTVSLGQPARAKAVLQSKRFNTLEQTML